MRNKELHDSILKSLRRITRSIDLHSRELSTTFGLTGPQLVCLRCIAAHDEVTPGWLAKEISLSQATVTGIIDRLLARQLVTRTRSQEDRRVVTVAATAAGRDLVQSAPHPLQESFLARLAAEPLAEQEKVRDTLEKVVRMMDGESIAAAPMLGTDSTLLTPDESPALPQGHVAEP